MFVIPPVFLFNHIAQQSVDAPIKIWFLNFRWKPPSQLPNKSSTQEGVVKPKEIWHMFQHRWAIWQSKNKYWIVSPESQKQQLVFPFDPLFSRLSFVRITPCLRYHKKPLFLRSTLSFQISVCIVPLFIVIFLYIDATVKDLFLFKFHWNLSLCSVKKSEIMLSTTCSHCFSLSPVKARLNETFKGMVSNTLATKSFF